MAFSQQTQRTDNFNPTTFIQTTTPKVSLLPALATSIEAEYFRVGNDLEIKILGDAFIIQNYFTNPVPLKTVDGTIVSVDDIMAWLRHPTEPILLAANHIDSTIDLASLKQIGTIIATVEGPITAQNRDGKTRTLQEGDPVYLDDTITTMTDSYVRITLMDGTVFQLGPHSHARLDKYTYDSEVAGGEFEAFVSAGSFRYISGKISGDNQGQHTLIKTPSTHVGIRGSEIDVWLDESGSTTVLHLSGLITVASDHHPGEQIVYERGTTVYIPNSSAAAITVSTITEGQIQQINQKWDVFNSLESVQDEFANLPQSHNKVSLSDPTADPQSQENLNPLSPPDSGARNPFAPSTKDVNAGDTIDEPLSSHDNLRDSAVPQNQPGYQVIIPLAAGETTRFSSLNNVAEVADSLTSDPESIITTVTDNNNNNNNLPSSDNETLASAPDGASFIGPNDSIAQPSDNPLPANDGNSSTDNSQVPSDGTQPTGEDSFLPTDQNNITPNNNDTQSASEDSLPTDKSDTTSSNSDTLPSNGNIPQPSSDISLPNETTSQPIEVPINHAPIAQNDFITLNNQGGLNIAATSILRNDQDLDGDQLHIVDVTTPSSGSVRLEGESTIIFTPTTPSIHGEFNYIVSDGKDTAVGRVIITQNLPPIAQEDTLEINSLDPLTIPTNQLLANDTDPNNDTLSVVSVSQEGRNGSVAFDNQGNIVFTPKAEIVDHQLGQFTYEVDDGHGESVFVLVIVNFVAENPSQPSQPTDEQAVPIDDLPPDLALQLPATNNNNTPEDNHPNLNQAPIAHDDGPFDMGNQNSITIAISDLLSNDSDPDNESLILTVTQVQHGRVTLNDEGQIFFTRGATFQNQGGFNYEVSDSHGNVATAHVTITSRIIQPPKLEADQTQTLKNQPLILPIAVLLTNDAPLNTPNEVLTLTAVNNARHGEVSLDETGNVIFIPESDFVGSASFDYVVTNSEGGNATTSVTVAVINTTPIAQADQFNTLVDVPLLITAESLLANDNDDDNDTLTIVSVNAANQGTQGTVELVNDEVLFTPASGFEGQTDFIYTLADSSDAQATARVTVTVERMAVNDEMIMTTKNTAVIISPADLLANDNGSDLVITTVNNAHQGTVETGINGEVVFTPLANFIGEASFQYTVTDIMGNTANATVLITVENTPPVVQSDTATTTKNTPLAISVADLLENDHDPDPQDELRIESVIPVSHGIVKLAEDEVVFLPEADFTGEASFEYTVIDNSGETATATVMVTITPPENLPPVITLPNNTTPLVYNAHDEPIFIDSAAQVTDSDSPNFEGGTLKVAILPNQNPNDVLAIQNHGPIQVSSETGGEITFNGTPIGTFFTIFSPHLLMVQLNANADPIATEALIQSISYQNISATPVTEVRTVKMTLTDGDGGTSAVVSRDIEITTDNIEPIAEDDNVSRPFNTPTIIPVTELLQNDQDVDPADILSISELTNLSEGLNAKLVGNEIQLFIDALVSNDFESAHFDYKVSDGQGGEDLASVTLSPTNVKHGTSEDDHLEGSNQLDIILGEAGNDTFAAGEGADILLGGDHDDLFLFDPNTAERIYIEGNDGIDTLSLVGVENNTFDLITNRILPSERQIHLQGIEKIDLSSHSEGRNQLRLGIEDVLDISENNRLIIEGDATSMVNSMTQGWHHEGLDSTGLYNHYSSDEAELLVSINISNQFIS